ncbi:Glutathione peroxidase [Penicillium sp. IBT 31633x]|nr:Glutathione peroxidase [Penicillium sp. IBT 31633x]
MFSTAKLFGSSISHSAKSFRSSTTSYYRCASPRTSPPCHFAYPRQITTMSSATSFFDFEPVDKKGEPFPLSSLNGKVVLVVNTASKCGFTPQFEGLEKLYQKLKAKYPEDFTIIGFPCNQFGSQDPGTDDEIQSFCQLNYGVSFPVLGKLDVNGSNAAPVWTFLKEQQPGIMGIKSVKWNFEKFLVSPTGKVVGRWASLTKPEGLEDTIVKEIEKSKKEGTLASLKKAEAGTESAKLS